MVRAMRRVSQTAIKCGRARLMLLPENSGEKREVREACRCPVRGPGQAWLGLASAQSADLTVIIAGSRQSLSLELMLVDADAVGRASFAHSVSAAERQFCMSSPIRALTFTADAAVRPV